MAICSQENHDFNFTRVGVGSSTMMKVKNYCSLIWNQRLTHPNIGTITDNDCKPKSFDVQLSVLNSNYTVKGGLQIDCSLTQHFLDVCKVNEPAPTLINTVGIFF